MQFRATTSCPAYAQSLIRSIRDKGFHSVTLLKNVSCGPLSRLRCKLRDTTAAIRDAQLRSWRRQEVRVFRRWGCLASAPVGWILVDAMGTSTLELVLAIAAGQDAHSQSTGAPQACPIRCRRRPRRRQTEMLFGRNGVEPLAPTFFLLPTWGRRPNPNVWVSGGMTTNTMAGTTTAVSAKARATSGSRSNHGSARASIAVTNGTTPNQLSAPASSAAAPQAAAHRDPGPAPSFG